MANTIKTIFQVRRGNSSEWNLVNPILREGEPGFAKDTFEFKIGDGKLPWKDLPSIGGDYTVSFSADGKSIIIENDNIKLFGFDGAQAGQIPKKNESGQIEWYFPVKQEEINKIKEKVDSLPTKFISEITEVKVNETSNIINGKVSTLQLDGTYTITTEDIAMIPLVGKDQNDNGHAGLMSYEDKEKLDNLGSSNIENISIDGENLTINNATVNIPLATNAGQKGVVKNLEDTDNKTNAVSINSDGTMKVEELCVDKLVNSLVNILVLDGGNSEI